VTLYGLPAGQYFVRWWDPRTVPTSNGAYVSHPGGDLHASPPSSPTSDWVLFVRNAASGPHEEPYDVAITTNDGVAIVEPGQSLTYTTKATNPGNAAVSGATVTDTFPAALQGVTWTCAAVGGASCTAASGSGNINQVVDLPVASALTFTATGTLSPAASNPVSNAATVTLPPGVSDPDLSNNSATDVDTIGGSGAAFGFYTLTPCRLVDTRDLGAPIGGPILQSGQRRDFAVVGQCGIPSAAKALSLNVTVVQPSAQGFVRLVPPGGSATISTVNFQAAETRANNAIVPLNDGQFSAEMGGFPGSVHLIVDVSGYFQ
jgi:uncharacterized repeat protein (TIGR01451 family)